MNNIYNDIVPSELLELLNKNFNILGMLSFIDFDYNFSTLREFLLQSKKETYALNDRYFFIHQDTDIYIPEISVGVNFRNFITILNELDIPLFTIIIWTNHFGLQREIDILCKKDKPTLLESFCSKLHVGDHYDDIPIGIDNIKYHALSMMGACRSHRFALYNYIKDEEKISISIKGLKT